MTTTSIVDFAAQELGVKLYPGQAEALTAYYQSGRPNWLFLAGRRSGKSLLSDIIACYEACIPDFSDVLRPGEERFIIILSVRQDNANLHIDNISKLLRHSKALRGLVADRTKERIQLTNGVSIISLPASGRSVRGYGACTAILDELAHFVDSQGINSADAVFDAITPVLATYGERGKLIITTTPLSKTGIVYDLYDRATQGELDDFYITRASSQEMNPKIADRVIQRAMKRDPESAAVEYFAEFCDPVAAFLDGAAIERAIDPKRRRVETRVQGTKYVMAIDPATLGDRYAFVVCHSDKGLVFLDYVQKMNPPVNPNEAEELLFDLDRRFKPTKIKCDTASTVERLKGKLPNLEYTPFTRPMKLRIYGSLKEAFNLDRLIIYREDDLIDELRALQIRNGVDISAPKSGRVKHDDLADCLALCVDELTTRGIRMGTVTITKNPFYDERVDAQDYNCFDQGDSEAYVNPETGCIETFMAQGARHEPVIDRAWEEQQARLENVKKIFFQNVKNKLDKKE